MTWWRRRGRSTACSGAAGKLRGVPADTPDQRVTAARRLVAMLARKGYPGGLAHRVVREVLAAHGGDVDELGTDPTDD